MEYDIYELANILAEVLGVEVEDVQIWQDTMLIPSDEEEIPYLCSASFTIEDDPNQGMKGCYNDDYQIYDRKIPDGYYGVLIKEHNGLYIHRG